MNKLFMNKLICNKISESNLFLAFLLLCILNEKFMINELLDGHSITWILLKTFIQKISCLFTYINIGRNRYLIFYYFYQLFFLAYLERILPN